MNAEDLDDAADREHAALLERRRDRQRRHAANLAALDALLALEAAASATPWRAQRVPTNHGLGGDVAQLHAVNDSARGFAMLAPGEMAGADAALVAALRNGAKAALQARRRMLVRHAPNDYGDCSRCADVYESPEPWPCEDYADAVAGLVMPHRVTVSVDRGAQLAAAACVCCGWSRTVPFARVATGAPVAERLAEVWARRHLEGDPAAQLDDQDAAP
jgi:hypothetical protein